MSDPGAGDSDAADTDGPAGGGIGERGPGDGRTSRDRGEPDRRSDAGGTTGRDKADGGPETLGEGVRWFFRTDHGAVVYVREVLSSVGLVLLVALLLFAVSGLWPPMVAVESESMTPNMQRGDLVFVMEEHRLAPGAAYEDTGVVTYRTGERAGYEKFNRPGDVVVFEHDDDPRTAPIIHRVRFWVNESENWVANGKAQQEHLGAAQSCGQISHCPAPHAGFVTKGDANGRYDQVFGLSEPVKPSWVIGTAEFRIPWLGNIRLLAGQSTLDPRAASAAPGPQAAGGSGMAAAATADAPPRCAWS